MPTRGGGRQRIGRPSFLEPPRRRESLEWITSSNQSGRLAQTGVKLLPGEVCYSAVVPKGNEWERIDFSRDAWQGAPEDALGYWRTKVPPPVETRRRLDPHALFRHFEQLCEDANPAQNKFRYVLALLLVQRRRLRITGTRTEGPATLLELAGTHGEGPFAVPELQLKPEEIETLENELNERLTVEPISPMRSDANRATAQKLPAPARPARKQRDEWLPAAARQ